jgi:tetratricopeptide (TPR) repeat protein
MKKTIIGIALLAIALPASAQGVSEANGSVVDREGNPVQGVVVSFRAKSNPEVSYDGKTNKKGRYFVSGMFSVAEGEMWVIELESDEYTPVEVRIESRTVQKVLVGDPLTAKLKPGKKPPEFPIRPLGKAIVDWKVAPLEDVEAEMQAAAQAAATEAAAVAGTAEGGGEAAEPAKDPWVEALTLASAGALEDSVPLFREAVEAEPEDAERHETFAKILYRLEEYDDALVEAGQAVELEPSRMESHLVRFNVHDSRGDLEQAKIVLEAAQQAKPDDMRILSRLGYVARESGDIEGAIAAYTRVTELVPDNAEAWLALADLHAEAGRLAESEAAYAKVVEIDPKGAHQTYYNLGATIIKRNNRSESDTRRAIDAFRKALELKPDYALAARELAFALIGLTDRDGAREVLQTFVDKNPSSPETPGFKKLLQSLGPVAQAAR